MILYTIGLEAAARSLCEAIEAPYPECMHGSIDEHCSLCQTAYDGELAKLAAALRREMGE